MNSFDRSATVAAQIKAPAGVVDGKRSGEMQVVASIHIQPLAPASTEIQKRVMLQTPTALLVTYFQAAADLTVRDGYTLAVGSTEYPIRDLTKWPWQDGARAVTYELVVEDLQNR